MIRLTEKLLRAKTYLIFDLDGTIINTDKANFLSYQEAVKNIDLQLLYKSHERFTRENLNFQEYEKIVEIKTRIFQKNLKYTVLALYKSKEY